MFCQRLASFMIVLKLVDHCSRSVGRYQGGSNDTSNQQVETLLLPLLRHNWQLLRVRWATIGHKHQEDPHDALDWRWVQPVFGLAAKAKGKLFILNHRWISNPTWVELRMGTDETCLILVSPGDLPCSQKNRWYLCWAQIHIWRILHLSPCQRVWRRREHRYGRLCLRVSWSEFCSSFNSEEIVPILGLICAPGATHHFIQKRHPLTLSFSKVFEASKVRPDEGIWFPVEVLYMERDEMINSVLHAGSLPSVADWVEELQENDWGLQVPGSTFHPTADFRSESIHF